MNTFKVDIFSPKNNIVFNNVISISANAINGKFMILSNHAPYLYCILPGVLVIKKGNAHYTKLTISRGILQVANNYCTIIINNFLE